VNSEEKAEVKARMMVQSKSIEKPSPKPTHGLGVKKRILRMLVSLIDLNNGKPVHLSTVLEECFHAGINREKTLHFLDMLSSEGVVQNHTTGLTVDMEVVA
jgi:hypothetical protein